MSLDNIHRLAGQINALEDVQKELGRIAESSFDDTVLHIDLAKAFIGRAIEDLIEAMGEEDHVV